MRNRKGFIEIASIVLPCAASLIISGMVLVTGNAFVKTAKDGTLKKNGQIIKCKMANNGNDYCDALYGPSSMVKEEKQEKQGRTLTAFLRKKLN